MSGCVLLAEELNAQSRGPLGGQKIQIWCFILPGLATTRLGSVWLDWLCCAGLGSARLPLAPFGLARFGLSRLVWLGLQLGSARSGSAWPRQAKACFFVWLEFLFFYCKLCGFSEIGKKNSEAKKMRFGARPGPPWLGSATTGMGSAGLGSSRLGVAALSLAWPTSVLLGLAWLASARLEQTHARHSGVDFSPPTRRFS